jgi:uncharacterized protein (TIGR02118 family)
MRGVLKYVGDAALQSATGGDPPFDAVSEHWWESIDAVRTAFTSPEWQAARKDHPAVVSGRFMFLAEEYPIQDVPPGADPVKYVAFLSRKDTQSRKAFRDYWLQQHVPLALRTPGLIGYRANIATISVNGDSILKDTPDAPPFDGVVEMWFESLDAFNVSFRDPFWDQLRADYYQGFAMGRMQLVVKEHVVLDRIGEAGLASRLREETRPGG